MAAPNERAAQQDEASGRPVLPAGPPKKKDPYADLLCTICGLKACWMTPEAKAEAKGSTRPSR